MANKFNKLLLSAWCNNILRVSSRNLSEVDKSNLKQIVSRIVSNSKGVDLVPTSLRKDSIVKQVQNVVTKYENFTGVSEIMELQNKVVAAQEKFMEAQEKRRELGREVADIEARLKQLHSDMQNTSKGDDKYLHLCTEEHKLILQERSLRQEFMEAEREERELFAAMSSAVKAGHERERAHAERNKYWYIVASILGTVLGIAGSTINNSLKMAEFRDLMEQQMARSMLQNISNTSGVAAAITSSSIPRDIVAPNINTKHQEDVMANMKLIEKDVSSIAKQQAVIIETLQRHDKDFQLKLRDLKRTILVSSQASEKSDAELAKMLNVVQHEIDEQHLPFEMAENKIAVEKNELIAFIGAVSVLATLVGIALGKFT